MQMLPEKCKSQAHMLQCEALWESTWWKLNILETSWFLIEKFKKLKIFKPSAHNAIVSEENSKDSNDNVRVADADNSDHIVNCLSVRTGI